MTYSKSLHRNYGLASIRLLGHVVLGRCFQAALPFSTFLEPRRHHARLGATHTPIAGFSSCGSVTTIGADRLPAATARVSAEGKDQEPKQGESKETLDSAKLGVLGSQVEHQSTPHIPNAKKLQIGDSFELHVEHWLPDPEGWWSRLEDLAWGAEEVKSNAKPGLPWPGSSSVMDN